MISANQMYKQSKSSLHFKDWLKNTQQRGILDNHEKMYNLIENGDEEETPKLTTQEATKKFSTISLLGIVGIVVLIYGLSKVSSQQ
jgi:DNA-binding GntR family transcriptional regulator